MAQLVAPQTNHWTVGFPSFGIIRRMVVCGVRICAHMKAMK